jgi:polar amino acid transport system substrate-binding protein
MNTFLCSTLRTQLLLLLLTLCGTFSSFCAAIPVISATTKIATTETLLASTLTPVNSSPLQIKQTPIYSEDKKITLVTDHWQPFYGPDLDQGGYIIEICKAAFAATGYELTIKFMPWKRATKAVSRGIYDGLLGAYYTAERADYLYYSQALAKERTSLIALKSRNLSYKNKADLKGHIIGVMRAAVNDTDLDNNENLSFSYANDASHNLQKLMAGRIDYMITGEAHLSYLVKHDHSEHKKIEISALQVFQPPIKVNPIYITIRKVRKNSAGLIAAFNKGIDIIKKNGEYAQIKHKHLSSLNMPYNALPLLDFLKRVDIVAR